MFDADALPAFEPPELGEHQDESDDEERPPLRGSTAPPAGLHDVDWASLDDAYGTADETPLFIEALTSDDAGDRNFGVYGLYSATTHQGSVYPASKLMGTALSKIPDVRDVNDFFDVVDTWQDGTEKFGDGTAAVGSGAWGMAKSGYKARGKYADAAKEERWAESGSSSSGGGE